LSDQVVDLFQENISVRDSRPNRERLGNKAADIPVNIISAARSDMGPHNLQSGIFCHVTTGCPENVVQDHGKVYNVTYHTSNIFLADRQRLSE
jgi:hypothetical protein